jgi:hypothetical protein
MSQQNLDDSPFLKQPYPISEPFLWVHASLLAAVPLTLVLSMIGLAVGDPVLPGWLETLLLGLPPIALTVWLQWQKPLSPFSLWFGHKPSDTLSHDQRKILTILKDYTTGWIAVVAGIFVYVIFRQMYITAPLAAGIIPFPSALRLVGVLWAEVFMLISCLLWQAGVAAVRILLVSEFEFVNTVPYEVEQIKAGFLTLGKRSPKLLEFVTAPVQPKAPRQQKQNFSFEPMTKRPLEREEEPSAELIEEFQEQLKKSVLPGMEELSENDGFLSESSVLEALEPDVSVASVAASEQLSEPEIIAEQASEDLPETITETTTETFQEIIPEVPEVTAEPVSGISEPEIDSEQASEDLPETTTEAYEETVSEVPEVPPEPDVSATMREPLEPEIASEPTSEYLPETSQESVTEADSSSDESDDEWI